MMSQVKPLSLSFLNEASLAWAELEYNRKVHDEIGCSPIQQMLKGRDVGRPSPDSETLRFAFSLQERRTQRRSDGTITIKGVRFELPSCFKPLRSCVRALPVMGPIGGLACRFSHRR